MGKLHLGVVLAHLASLQVKNFKQVRQLLLFFNINISLFWNIIYSDSSLNIHYMCCNFQKILYDAIKVNNLKKLKLIALIFFTLKTAIVIICTFYIFYIM